MSRPSKIILASVAAILVLVLAAAAGIFVLVQTAWFKDKVRERIVSVVEQATGGRVDIGRFNYNWQALSAEVRPFVLHGSEPASAPPLFRAEKIQIGLKVISTFKKQVDIASLKIDKPEMYVIVGPDGSTNIPTLKNQYRQITQALLDLKVQHFEMRDGLAVYNSKRFPMDLRAERLHASLIYDASGPRYAGKISSAEVRLASPQLQTPLAFALATEIALEPNALQVMDANLSSAGWKVQAKGCVNDLANPRAVFDLNASAGVDALKKLAAIPLESRGTVSFQGQATLDGSPPQYKLRGKLTARDLGLEYNNTEVTGIGLGSSVEATPQKVSLPDVNISAMDGHFSGSAALLPHGNLALTGTMEHFSLRDLAEVDHRQTGQLNGLLSGPVSVKGVVTPHGLADVTAEAKLDIAPLAGGVPVQGAVSVAYDQRAGKLSFENFDVNLGSTHASFSGTLGENLSARVVSKNLDDFLPLFPLVGETAPSRSPVALESSTASFDGIVAGPLANPHFSGKADLGPFVFKDRKFDHAVATFDLDRDSANFRSLTVDQGKMRLEGQGSVSLRNWKLEESAKISALLSITGGDISKLASENGFNLPVSGSVTGTLHVSGSVDAPLAAGNLQAQNITAYGEHFDSARGDITLSAASVEVSNAEIRSGSARLALNATYEHPANDWKDGSLRFDLTSARLTLAQIKHLEDLRPGLGGDVDAKGSGTAKVVNGMVDLTSLNGQLSVRNATVDGHPYGRLNLTASTRLPVLAIAATADLRGIDIHGSGEWRMEGAYPGQARIQIPRVPFDTLHDLAPEPHERVQLPFEGFLTGEVTIAGPLNRPADMKADINLTSVQLSARQDSAPKAGNQDLVLRNAEPVRLEATNQGIDIRSANFTAKDTSLTATGHLAFDSRNPWDLNIQGNINLSILQIFNPNLLASGASIIRVAVQGPLTEPQVDGRLELHNASLFLRDFPNGVDQANGLIVFDRNRATVQNLSAVTGGGTVTFDSGSFVGFRGPVLNYRIQASARNVRYRSPDGISVTTNATLSLLGTSDNSVLSGNVVVSRAAFNPRTDVGALLASTQTPVSANPEANAYLRGVQFDVSVQSARSLEVETSLTRDIQADASLRLRGTPDHPVVLGSINVNSGQIEFFGDKYTIDRGTITFNNPLRIEPVIDMALQTQVRGITVDIAFSGSLNKLNFSYRSDPPLQANEIIALLAVGRAPATAGSLRNPQTTATTGAFDTGSNALLSQAIAPSTGRLQKLFGVSHIKIDPSLTDITSIPSARVTFEQQVSSDVTLTYITNLAVTNQQIVRVEWDLNKRWSVVALRDENGAFGIDFVFKKRYK